MSTDTLSDEILTGRIEEYPSRAANTRVSIHPLLERRWSPVKFDADAELAREDLVGVLEAGRWAPSCYGEEPWRFIVARRGDAHRPKLEETLSDGNAWARRASVLIATLASGRFSRNERPNRWAAHDTGIATFAMMVEATSRGLITHAMGGFDAGALADAFGVPDEYEPMSILAVGFHDPELDEERLTRKEGRSRERRPLQETVFGERFGRSYL